MDKRLGKGKKLPNSTYGQIYKTNTNKKYHIEYECKGHCYIVKLKRLNDRITMIKLIVNKEFANIRWRENIFVIMSMN